MAEEEEFEIDLPEGCTWEEALHLIQSRKLGGQHAADVFAFYFDEANGFDANVMRRFINAGVDINLRSPWYYCDTHNGNALIQCCEFRMLDRLEIILNAGADVTVEDYRDVDGRHFSVLLDYISGHNPWYEIIDSQTELDNWLRGFKLLIDHGTKFTQDEFDWIATEYSGKYLPTLLQRIEEYVV